MAQMAQMGMMPQQPVTQQQMQQQQQMMMQQQMQQQQMQMMQQQQLQQLELGLVCVSGLTQRLQEVTCLCKSMWFTAVDACPERKTWRIGH